MTRSTSAKIRVRLGRHAGIDRREQAIEHGARIGVGDHLRDRAARVAVVRVRERVRAAGRKVQAPRRRQGPSGRPCRNRRAPDRWSRTSVDVRRFFGDRAARVVAEHAAVVVVGVRQEIEAAQEQHLVQVRRELACRGCARCRSSAKSASGAYVPVYAAAVRVPTAALGEHLAERERAVVLAVAAAGFVAAVLAQGVARETRATGNSRGCSACCTT